MYEVEQKAHTDLNPVRSRLELGDATFERTIVQRDTYFQHPQRDFAETDEALRIRRIRDVDGNGPVETILTYKGPRLDRGAKTRRELETAVADGETVAAILESLGFAPVATVTKRRERWRLNDAVVCLDDVEGLGTFIEVEAATDPDDIDEAATRASTLLAELGVDADATTTESYLGMILDDRDEPG